PPVVARPPRLRSRRAPAADAVRRDGRRQRADGGGGPCCRPRDLDRAHVRLDRAPLDHRRVARRPVRQEGAHRRASTRRRRDPSRRRRRDLQPRPGLLRRLHRPGLDRERVRGRVVPHGGRRRARRRRLAHHHRSQEGHHHPGRREHQRRRGGERAAAHRRRARVRGRGRARRPPRRARVRVRAGARAVAGGRAGGDGGGRSRQAEVAGGDQGGPRLPAHRVRQGPEVRAAHAATGGSDVSDDALDGWEIVIGLEVHCELATRTKLFCGCPNVFGDEPNTNICPVCLGLPGSLPVLNEQAVELALRLGQALHCRAEYGVFARKNYFYPDMPKDYQVSQYDLPTNVDGHLDLPSGLRVGIERAHIEEDTGKNTHVGGDGRIHGAEYSLIDYNRAGVPLVEIVSRPDLRGAEQAREYVGELRDILLATDASDARMEEGSMRVDANVSVRRAGDTAFGTRCEIKNLNSLRSLGRAIEYEARRQVELIGRGERVVQETRHWDEAAGRTRPGRNKEEAEDYRYFPEPD